MCEKTRFFVSIYIQRQPHDDAGGGRLAPTAAALD
jgi:hypothetical protein